MAYPSEFSIHEILDKTNKAQIDAVMGLIPVLEGLEPKLASSFRKMPMVHFDGVEVYCTLDVTCVIQDDCLV